MSIVLIGVIGLIIILVIARTAIKESAKYKILPADELLRFFVEGEQMNVPTLSKKIIERTAGKRDVPYALLHRQLVALVEQGLLERQEEVIHQDKVPGGVKSVTYSLPIKH